MIYSSIIAIMLFMKNVYVSIIVILVVTIAGLFIFLWESKEEEIQLTKENNNIMEEKKDNLIKIEEGLEVEILVEGSGLVAENGDLVIVHYVGKLEDESIFDSSLSRNQPFPFNLGAGDVIAGWEKGVFGMKVGEKRNLKISPELAYGERGIVLPDGKVIIPGGATLFFEVELLNVQKPTN